jgi:DNA repair protein RecO (recombination protein O)
MIHRDEAICIKTSDYSETSQIVTLFTRKGGKISLIAKGAKRKKSAFAGPLEVLSFGDALYSESQSAKLATLREFDPRPIFMLLRTRLFAMNQAYFAVELVGDFIEEHDPNPEVFERLKEFLENLQSCDDENHGLRYLILFQLSLFELTGIGLTRKQCANCGNANFSSAVYFSSQANGLLCRDCEISYPDKTRIDRAAAELLNDLSKISQADLPLLQSLERLLVVHICTVLGKKPKMADTFIQA